ncbi:hypothetical protein BCR42DRAFT_415852 [Absidia repens]|uniref:Ricin B lectin domain-containing protein n=1 Tax=Absidia repens TaxID=90262 RepID=A0A1X2IG27_9FUNG|nr:hypothetical protein BCR42DRAFT_415852 [Absidia repens]
MNTENNAWFYIQSTKTGKVIAVDRHIKSEGLVPLRSQVRVYTPHQTSDELWTWDGQFIRNKATDLVLDIRKGRLRLIEDTEICLYDKKPLDKASNQLWGVRDAPATTTTPAASPLLSPQGKLIYSISNTDWILTQDEGKLLLHPQEPLMPYDTWDWIAEDSFIPSLSSSPPTTADCDPATPGLSSSVASSCEFDYHQGGLSPARKRGSQGSVSYYSMDGFKDCYERLYKENDTHLSDKAISMAVAYDSWLSASTADYIKEKDELGRIQLLNQAEQKALDLLSKHHQDHHKETILHLTGRYINILLDHKVHSS